MTFAMVRPLWWLQALCLGLASLAWQARAQEIELPPPDPLGVSQGQLDAGYWIRKLERPDQRILDSAAIEAQNARLRASDPTWHDIEALPQTLDAEQVKTWVDARSQRPQQTLYDEAGKQGNERQIDRLVAALDLGAIPQTQITRFGLVVRRASLRTFPTHLRVFTAPDDTDIDRFQETALFPGTPVVIAHVSRDRKWWFVVSPLYTGWIERLAVAEGTRDDVFGYVHRTPTLTVTDAKVRTVYTPGAPALSELELDMGTRVPHLTAVPPTAVINGQLAYAAWPVQLPVRTEDGQLAFSPALIPRNADVAREPLPLTRANILRQAFKFLGERYGWGHDYNGRDCSGFVSEVYRSMGVLMPRNTSDQARSPAFDRIAFDATTTPEQRAAALRRLQVGDLVYVPGHVMMVIGRERGEPWVIHDVQGVSVRNAQGALQRIPLNAVSVTPLLPLRAGEAQAMTDRITAIVRMRPVK
ncbi:SH3 domain-containing protein [Lysobacter sp. M2-1]|uniref:C40 family peptidase n=1 Tax=Lysobacter sp. M2-1 TaxID=2916839 RepID=UPI001F59D3A6|nr:SH3 domain-containing protein [Lysobacter sp. M2-1]